MEILDTQYFKLCQEAKELILSINSFIDGHVNKFLDVYNDYLYDLKKIYKFLKDKDDSGFIVNAHTANLNERLTEILKEAIEDTKETKNIFWLSCVLLSTLDDYKKGLQDIYLKFFV